MSVYVIGVDFGTDSVRAALVDASNGTGISSSTFYYPAGKQDCSTIRRKIVFVSILWIISKDRIYH